jgi:hypothetical protein
MIGPTRPCIYQHVRWFDITMNEPDAVRGVQSARHRRDDRHRTARRKRPYPAKQGPDVSAWHIPHRDEQHPVCLASLEHRDDVGIINRRRRA